MPELLAHVLVGYVLGTVLSWRYDWLRSPHVTAVMAGVMLPDLNRLGLVVSRSAIETTFGVPFEWRGTHTLGGAAILVLLGATLAARGHRRRALALFALGTASHFVLDMLLATPSGHSFDVLWPLTQYHPPTPGLYLSSDRWPAAVSLGLATSVWGLDRRRKAGAPGDETGSNE